MKTAPSLEQMLETALCDRNWHDAAAYAAQALEFKPGEPMLRFLLAELHQRNFSARLATNELRRALHLALDGGDRWRAVAAQVALDQCRPGAGPEAFTRILPAESSHPVFSLVPDRFDALCREFAHVSLLPGDAWQCPDAGAGLVICITGDPRVPGTTGAPGDSRSAFPIGGDHSPKFQRDAACSFLYLAPDAFEAAVDSSPALRNADAWPESPVEAAAAATLPELAGDACDRHEVMLSIRCLLQEANGGEAALAGGQLMEVSERGCSFECSALPAAFHGVDPAGTRVVVQVQLRNRPEPLRWQGTLASVGPVDERPGAFRCGIRWTSVTPEQRDDLRALARGARRESAQLWQLWNSLAEVRR